EVGTAAGRAVGAGRRRPRRPGRPGGGVPRTGPGPGRGAGPGGAPAHPVEGLASRAVPLAADTRAAEDKLDAPAWARVRECRYESIQVTGDPAGVRGARRHAGR